MFKRRTTVAKRSSIDDAEEKVLPPRSAEKELSMVKKLEVLTRLAFARMDVEFLRTGKSKHYSAVVGDIVKHPLGIHADQLTFHIQTDIIKDKEKAYFWFYVMQKCIETQDYFTANVILNALQSPTVELLITDSLKNKLKRVNQVISSLNLAELADPLVIPSDKRLFEASNELSAMNDMSDQIAKELEVISRKLDHLQKSRYEVYVAIRTQELESLEEIYEDSNPAELKKVQDELDLFEKPLSANYIATTILALEAQKKQLAEQQIADSQKILKIQAKILQQMEIYNTQFDLYKKSRTESKEVQSLLESEEELKLIDQVKMATADDLFRESERVTAALMGEEYQKLRNQFVVDNSEGRLKEIEASTLTENLFGEAALLAQKGLQIKLYYWPNHVAIEIQELGTKEARKEYISWDKKEGMSTLGQDLLKYASDPVIVEQVVSHVDYAHFLSQYQAADFAREVTKKDSVGSVQTILGFLGVDNFNKRTPNGLIEAAKNRDDWSTDTTQTTSKKWYANLVALYLQNADNEQYVDYILKKLNSRHDAEVLMHSLASDILKEIKNTSSLEKTANKKIADLSHLIFEIKNKFKNARFDKDILEEMRTFSNEEKISESAKQPIQDLIRLSGQLVISDKDSLQAILVNQLETKDQKPKAIQSLIEIAKNLSMEKQYHFLREIIYLTPNPSLYLALMPEPEEYTRYLKHQAVVDRYFKERFKIKDNIFNLQKQLKELKDSKENVLQKKARIEKDIAMANKKLKKLIADYNKHIKKKPEFTKVKAALKSLYARLNADSHRIKGINRDKKDAPEKETYVFIINELLRSPDGKLFSDKKPLAFVSSQPASVEFATQVKDTLTINDCLAVAPKGGGKNDPGLAGAEYIGFYKDKDGQIHPRRALIKQATDEAKDGTLTPNHRENIAEGLAALCMSDAIGKEHASQVAGVVFTMPDRPTQGLTDKTVDPEQVYVASVYHPNFTSAHEVGIKKYYEIHNIKKDRIPSRPPGIWAAKDILVTTAGRHYYRGLEDLLKNGDADKKRDDYTTGAEYSTSLGRCLSVSLLFGNYQLHSENVGLSTYIDQDGNKKKQFVILDFGGAFRMPFSAVGGETGGFSKGIHPERSTDKKKYANYLLSYPKSIRFSKAFIDGIDTVITQPNAELKASIDKHVNELVKIYGQDTVINQFAVNLPAEKEMITKLPKESQLQHTKDLLYHTVFARKLSLKKMSVKYKLKNIANKKGEYALETLVKTNPAFFMIKQKNNSAAKKIISSILESEPDPTSEELGLKQQLEQKMVAAIKRTLNEPHQFKQLAIHFRNYLKRLNSDDDPEIKELIHFLENALKKDLFFSEDDKDAIIQACDQAYSAISAHFENMKGNEARKNYLIGIDVPNLINARVLSSRLTAEIKAKVEEKEIKAGNFTIINATSIINYIEGKLTKAEVERIEEEDLNKIATLLMGQKMSLINAIDEINKMAEKYKLPALKGINAHFANALVFVGLKEGGKRPPGEFGARYLKVRNRKLYLIKKDTEDNGHELNEKDISEFLSSQISNVMIPGIAPNFALEKHSSEEAPYICSEFFDSYKGLYEDIYIEYYQIRVAERLLKHITNIKNKDSLTAEKLDRLIQHAEQEAKDAVGDIKDSNSSDPDFLGLLKHLKEVGHEDSKQLKSILKKYIAEKDAIPKKRPYALGTLQKMGVFALNIGTRFRKAILRKKEDGSFRYKGLADALVVSLLLADFDTHGENVGVVTDPHTGNKSVKRIDFGAALVAKHFRNKEDVEMDSRSLALHRFGKEPTNHIKEYPSAIRVSLDFANAINLSVQALEKLLKDDKTLDTKAVKLGNVVDTINPWPIKSIVKFAEYIGITPETVAEFTDENQKETLLNNHIKPHMNRLLRERIKPMKKLELEIRISLCFTNMSLRSMDVDRVTLRKLIADKENHAYFRKGEFVFRSKGQDSSYNSWRIRSALRAEIESVLGKSEIKEEKKAETKDVLEYKFDFAKDSLGDALFAQLKSSSAGERAKGMGFLIEVASEVDYTKQMEFLIKAFALLLPQDEINYQLKYLTTKSKDELDHFIANCMTTLAKVTPDTHQAEELMKIAMNLCEAPKNYPGNLLNSEIAKIDKKSDVVAMTDLQAAFKQNTKITQCLFVSGKKGGANDPGKWGGNYLKSYSTNDGKLHVQKIFFKQATDDHKANHRENIAEVKAGIGIGDIVGNNAAGVIFAMHDEIPSKDKKPDPEQVYVGSIYLKNHESAHVSAFKTLGVTKIPKRKKGFFSSNDTRFQDGFNQFVEAKGNYEQSYAYQYSLGKCLMASSLYGNYQFHTENVGSADVMRDGKVSRECDILDFGGAYRRKRFIFGKEVKGKFGKMIYPYATYLRKKLGNYLESYPKEVRLSKGFIDGIDYVAATSHAEIYQSVEKNTEYTLQFFGARAYIDHFARELDTTGRTLKLTGDEASDIKAIKEFEYHRLIERQLSLQELSIQSKIDSPAFASTSNLMKEHPGYLARNEARQFKRFLKKNSGNFTPVETLLIRHIQKSKADSASTRQLAIDFNKQLNTLIVTLDDTPSSDLTRLKELQAYFNYALKNYNFSKESDKALIIQAIDGSYRAIKRTVETINDLVKQEEVILAMHHAFGEALSKEPIAEEKKEAIGTIPAPAIYQTAEALMAVIRDKKLADVASLNDNKIAWNTKFNQFELPANATTLDTYLKDMRTEQLNSKSHLVQVDNQWVRIYPRKEQNVDASPYDFFGFGIDMARGALAIINYSNIADTAKQKAIAELKSLIAELHESIKTLIASPESEIQKLEAAQKLYEKLNGHLVNVLIEYDCYTVDKNGNPFEKKQVLDGMAQARHMLWIQSHQQEAVCTVRGKIGNPVRELSFAKRIEFDAGDLQNYTSQKWFTEMQNNHPWARNFYDANPDILTLSPTSVQRNVPNIGNAWDESTILIDNDKVTDVISGIRLGITSPYKIINSEERERLTNRNHRILLTNQRLKQTVENYVHSWQGLMLDAKNEITIPILHLTLLDPGALRYLARTSGDDPEDMIKQKTLANIALQQYLENKSVFYNPLGHRVFVVESPNAPTPPDCHRVQFSLKEINNGINRWESFTIEKKEDIENSRQLIPLVVDKLEQLQRRIGKNSSLDMVIAFLKKPDISLLHLKDKKAQSAMETLCHRLFNGQFADIPIATQKRLALLVQAAYSLKLIVKESPKEDKTRSLFDWFDRRGPRSGKFIRTVTSIFRMDRAVTRPAYFHSYKSCYERIIAELLGNRLGGCKSAVDREGEISELTHGMYREFHDKGTIVRWDASNTKKAEFVDRYTDSQHKHNMSEAITGSPGTADTETNGQIYRKETSQDKEKSSLLRIARDGHMIKVREIRKELPMHAESPLPLEVEDKKEAPALERQSEAVASTEQSATPLSELASFDDLEKATDLKVSQTKMMTERMRVLGDVKITPVVPNQESSLPPVVQKNPELKAFIADNKASNVYQITSGDAKGGVYTDKRTQNTYQVYSAKMPDVDNLDSLIAYAHKQISTYVVNMGHKANIYVRNTSNEKLVQAYIAICDLNGLNLISDSEIKADKTISDKVRDKTNELKNLNPDLIRDEFKEVLSRLQKWCKNAMSAVIDTQQSLNKGCNLETLKELKQNFESDKVFYLSIMDKIDERAKFIAHADSKVTLSKIDSTLQEINKKIEIESKKENGTKKKVSSVYPPPSIS